MSQAERSLARYDHLETFQLEANNHITPQRQPEDADAALLPETLAEFVGQAGCGNRTAWPLR